MNWEEEEWERVGGAGGLMEANSTGFVKHDSITF